MADGIAEIQMRSWCGRFQWDGSHPFLFGTVVVPTSMMHHELEAALRDKFCEAWANILPNGFPMPNLIAMFPGAIFFVPEDN